MSNLREIEQTTVEAIQVARQLQKNKQYHTYEAATQFLGHLRELETDIMVELATHGAIYPLPTCARICLGLARKVKNFRNRYVN